MQTCEFYLGYVPLNLKKKVFHFMFLFKDVTVVFIDLTLNKNLGSRFWTIMSIKTPCLLSPQLRIALLPIRQIYHPQLISS